MESLGSFFNMGGYASFVWPSFVVSAVLLVGLLVLSLRRLKAEEAALSALETAAGGTAQPRAGDPAP